MAITSDIDLEFLQRRAKNVGLYCNRHRDADPTRGDLYVQETRVMWEKGGGVGNPPSLLRYADHDTVSNYIARRE